MDPRRIGKLWGRWAEPPADVTAALGDLDRNIAARPELAGPGRTLADVLRAAFLVPPGAGELSPDAGALMIGWAEGVPAFRTVPPPIDGAAVRDRGMAICRALRKQNPAARALRGLLGSRRVDLPAWWGEALAGRPEAIEREAESLGIGADLGLAVLRLAILPELARASEVYGALRPEGSWGRGDCPHCGQIPALGESRGLEQRRRLRCGWCAADWPGDRLRCPFCATTDHRALHYRFIEGEEDRRRLSLCDHCGGRLKVVSTLAPLSAPGLLVAELATVHLDLIEGAAGDP